MGCVQSHAARRAESSHSGSSGSSGSSVDGPTKKLRARAYLVAAADSTLPIDYSQFTFADSFEGSKTTTNGSSLIPRTSSTVKRGLHAVLCAACGHVHSHATQSPIRTAHCEAADIYGPVIRLDDERPLVAFSPSTTTSSFPSPHAQ